MFNVVRLVDVDGEAGRDHLLGDLRRAVTDSGATRTLVQPTLPGVRNGGDVLLRLWFDDVDQWRSAAPTFDMLLERPEVGRVNGADYPGAPTAERDLPAAVYRTLLLRVHPDTDDAALTRFEDDLRLLPRYVSSISSWQLSRVESAVGASPWTHVFEQEFRDLHGLTGPYLMHPIHWAYVDRWFDPECPEVIVRDRVCHSFCANP
ncbi:Dabb family protein [Mycolicibacterium flavescens]|uniref:Stress responsive protein n=1 Tax=Mycolicibacterium flavescens TaxID=1776 RepID=A0A1E3RKK1_MYCFV|nr:Dabb family protein [Mycolicibacterium flavescens]MCV7281116.1 Dabb family protein [Mycolicibacterium flavescens]ODQ90406.1 stress responsive protein [Mycolicibacterium flavescens]